MRYATTAALALALCWASCAAADTFDELAARMSVARYGNLVVAMPSSPEMAAAYARRIAAYDAAIRGRYFPTLDSPRLRVVIADDAFELERPGRAPVPDAGAPATSASGYYRPADGLIVASTAHGDGALLRELVRALVQADNPNAPHWFETAMASLYESSRQNGAQLEPVLDERMSRIPANADLDYDVFAGICDCSQVSADQLALIRLLLVHLDERDELASLYGVIKREGRYVTLLEALDAMGFDKKAWKTYAEQRVREFRESNDKAL